MLQKKKLCTLCSIVGVLSVFILFSCSNQKNTALTRFYHSTNTRYNIYFNANEAYKETLKQRNNGHNENLSQMLYIFPDNSDTTAMQLPGGNFTTTIDKATKAIKLHSIKARPQRNPNRRNDTEYQAWLQQKEYTPFMDKNWMLLAKAEFHEANYLRAITTFLYISKIYSSRPEIVAECRLWVARAYTEMGWMYEAGNILHKMDLAGGPPEKHKALYSAVKANYLIRSSEYPASIPHLEYAIKKEKDKNQKLRMKYLLGQIYEEMDDKANAYKAYGVVQGMNTPYNFTFNAKLRQLQLDPSIKGKDNILSSLSKMARSSKNKEYLDQVYYSMANVYMQYSDTAKAIENYRKAINESTRNGYDKAMAQITLGDIYFDRREFIPAQPCYSEALPQLKKNDPAYPRVFLRSDVLDELVVHAKVVYEQDSLQYLAQLPEHERLDIINKKIEELKKQEEEKKKEEERLNQANSSDRISTWGDISTSINNNQQNQSQQSGLGTSSTGNTAFYFYENQTVAQGKIAFQRQWGSRKLEDDWRRSSKSGFSSGFSDAEEDDDTEEFAERKESSDDKAKEENTAVDDVYSVEYYLQQLPFSEEERRASDVLIENALFNMGKIYKNRLEDFQLAIEAFNTDLSRFPETPNKEEIYYQLLLIYMQMGNKEMMAQYRNKLLIEFSEGQYATALIDPDYEWNFRHMPLLQDSLYIDSYDAYLGSDVETVRKNYEDIKTKYPLGDLMPKFAMLNALSFAQTRDVANLESNLKELIRKYPKADVTPLATDILGQIKDGKILLSDGTPITEFDWSKAYLGDNTLTDDEGKTLAFSEDTDAEYLLLLMFKPNTIDRNELLYEVADYNFSNYVIQTFDLSFENDPPYDILQIKGFEKFANIRSYLNKAFTEDGLVNRLDTNILVVPISVDNFTKVLPRLGYEQYTAFFTEHYEDQLPRLIAYWNKNEGEIDRIAEEQLIAENKTEDKPQIEDIVPVAEKKEDTKIEKDKPKETQRSENDKQITADDLLTKEQLEKAGEVNDAIEAVEDIFNNPVDGIKGLFNKYKNREKLTKEEKAERKEQERQENQRQKELKAIEKARIDSIKKVDKALADSITRAEKLVQDSVKSVERENQQQLKQEEDRRKREEKATLKAKEDTRKQKEQERENRQRQQKERQQQLAKERKEKEKAQNAARKEKERLQQERLRQKEKERKERKKN